MGTQRSMGGSIRSTLLMRMPRTPSGLGCMLYACVCCDMLLTAISVTLLICHSGALRCIMHMFNGRNPPFGIIIHNALHMRRTRASVCIAHRSLSRVHLCNVLQCAVHGLACAQVKCSSVNACLYFHRVSSNNNTAAPSTVATAASYVQSATAAAGLPYDLLHGRSEQDAGGSAPLPAALRRVEAITRPITAVEALNSPAVAHGLAAEQFEEE